MRMPSLFVTRVITALCVTFSMSVSAYAAPQPPLPNFADLVEQLMPAVVNISTTQKITTNVNKELQLPEGLPEELEEWMERYYGGEDRGPREKGEGSDGLEGRKAISLGSGFIIDPSGYIVTNNHVVAEAEEISVSLSNDTHLKAKLIGFDSKTDLALLKVETKKPLPYVKFGDSNQVRVGEWVIAIGNPYSLGGSVTVGIISARARDINAGPFDDFLQTDAAINKGNSGGPMFNIKGEVIGINTAIFSPSGGNIGIGFATPTSLAKPVIEQLRKSGKIQRGWLGVKIQNISDDIAESMELGGIKGALVVEVTKGSPAEKAGIRVGDVITRFDGKEVPSMRKLPRIVAETQIGKKVEVVLLRNHTTKTTTVVIGELQEKAEQRAEADKKKSDTSSSQSEIAGLTLSDLTSSLRSKYHLPADLQGVLITKVARNSEALERGLQPGHVIVAVNQASVNSVETCIKLLKQAQGEGKKSVPLLIQFQGDTQFIPLPLK